MPDLLYRLAEIDEIYRLRFAVLRPGMTPERIHFPGDDSQPPRGWHFGAFEPTGANVACLTLLATRFDNRDALQLRGMAVAPERRSQGIGSRLLAVAVHALRTDARVAAWPWWCNARVEAVAFYERNGWRSISDEFHIDGVGPHRKMILDPPPLRTSPGPAA